jgi:hypothetical protein
MNFVIIFSTLIGSIVRSWRVIMDFFSGDGGLNGLFLENYA